MNLSAPFIRRPVMTTFLMLAILIAGIMAFRKLPVSDLPNIEHPIIGVSASYPGATPETMVKVVTIPLEKELMNVSGVKEISSTTSRGETSIELNFDLNKNLDEAAREVQTALNRAEGRLPSDMEERPSYFKRQANQEHIMYLVLTSQSASVSELRDYSDLYIEPRLARIEGVAQVDTFGAPYAVKIQLNPEKLAARNLGLDEVLRAIKLHNSELPLGTIKTGTRMLTLELPGGLQDAKDFSNIVIAPGPVLLKDIATVIDGSDSDQEFHFLTKDNSSLALILGIKKISGANTVAISKAVNAAMPEITKDLPSAVQLKLWFDKAVWINESILDVEWSLIFAFILVVAVIFFSLGRLVDAMIPSLALPMSLIGTFVAMYYLHFSLDILSLLALTLSVGFVVDDAIVVLENIVRHNEKGEAPMTASLQGSKEICFTVLSMTLSLVAVFIPILFMGGINGRLFHEFSVTLAIAILVSGFISLTLTPMLCSRLLRGHNSETRLQRWTNNANGAMVRAYGKSLKWCLHHPKTILAVALLCFGVTIPLFKSLPIELFPQEDRGLVISIVNLPKGLSDEKLLEYQKKIEKLIMANPHVDTLLDLTWEGSQLYLTQLKNKNERPPQMAIIQDIQNGIDSIPGTQSFSMGWQLFNIELDLTSGGNYKFLVRGMNADEVESSAEALTKALKGSSDFPYVNLNVKRDEPKLVVDVQEDQAEKYGVSKRHVQSLLQQAFAGGSIGNINKDGSQYKVFVELDPDYRNSPSSLAKLHVKTPAGKLVPLKALATWQETLGTPTQRRIDQLPAVTLSFALNKGIPIQEGMQRLEKIASETMPATVVGRLDGAAAMVASTVNDTTMLILASVIVMYIVLGMLYESFIHPLTILSSLPLAGLGGILTLLLFNEPLSLFSVMGFLLLIGIVKKNGIMMVDFALEARKDPSVSAEKAIYDGCLVRFRPIMMTTFSAIMGAIPIAIGFGEGGETRQGLGLVIAGGLIFSQMLTLYVTPVIYLSLENLRSRFQNRAVAAEPNTLT